MALDQSALLDLLGQLKLTDVSDRIRSATETLYQELIDAEAAAVIGAQPWRANRHHLLWPAVEIAVGARVHLLDLIREQIQRSEGVDAYLYGSLARRQSSPDSDVDILLVFPNAFGPEQIADIAGDLSDNIVAWTGNQTQMLSVRRSELRELIREGGSIVRSFDTNAVPLVGRPFSELRADLEKTARG